MKRLSYTPQAEIDVFDIVEYTSKVIEDTDAAFDVGDALYDQCEKLASLPGTLGHPRADLGEGLRTFPFKSFVIVFRYVGERLEVTRILHAKRDIDELFRRAKE